MKRCPSLTLGLAWVLDAASQWKVWCVLGRKTTLSNEKTTEFVGLDVVPIQPDLEASSLDPEVRERVQWVTANLYVPPSIPQQ